MPQDILLHKSRVELVLAKGTEAPPEVKTIRSPDKVECIELTVFEGRHLIVAAYDLIQTPSGETRKLTGFDYLFRCIDDVMHEAVRHYGEIIAKRYQERLSKVMPQENSSSIVSAAS